LQITILHGAAVTLESPALRFLKRIRDDAAEANLQVSICGEAAGRPLEAMAFIALGFRRLSMPASGIGPVKRVALAMNAGEAASAIVKMLRGDGASMRRELTEFASEMNVPL